MNVSPDRQRVRDRRHAVAHERRLVIARSARPDRSSWVKVAVLFVRSGSAVFELTVAASAIVCPAVPPASVPVIVICSGAVRRRERRARAHDRPAGSAGKRARESAARRAGRRELARERVVDDDALAVSGPLFETVSV